MPWGQVPASLQSFWQGCFGSLLCLVCWGACRPLGGAIAVTAGGGEEWSCGSATSLSLGSCGFIPWLCCWLPAGKAWSGTLSSYVPQLHIAWYHVILEPQPGCSKMPQITWQPTASLVSSVGNLQGDTGPSQNLEAPGPSTLKSGSCSFHAIENEVLQKLSQQSLIMLLWWNFPLCPEFA